MNKNPEIQFRSPEEIKAYQESRLAEELLYLQNHSRFYQRLFQAVPCKFTHLIFM